MVDSPDTGDVCACASCSPPTQSHGWRPSDQADCLHPSKSQITEAGVTRCMSCGKTLFRLMHILGCRVDVPTGARLTIDLQPGCWACIRIIWPDGELFPEYERIAWDDPQ